MRGLITKALQNSFLQNSFVLFLGTMVVNVLNYVFHLIIGRTVDPSTYGEVESLISLLTIISVPAGTLVLVATKYAASLKADGDVQNVRSLSRYLHKKIFQYGIPLFFFALLLTPFVRDFLGLRESLPIVFLWGIMLLSFLSAVATGVLVGWQKFASTSIAGVLSTALKLGIAIVFLKAGFGVSGVVGSYALATLAAYLIMLLYIRRFFAGTEETRPLDESAIDFSALKRYVLPAFYGTLSLAILGNIDMIFAKHHLEADASGEYGALSIVAKTIFFATGVLTTVLFAMSAEESSKKETSRTFQLATALTVLVSFGSVGFFALFPEFIMQLLFGEKYLAVSHLLVWFALAAAWYSLANLFAQYLLSLQETRVTLYFLALASLEILTLFFFGETLYAIIGITIATQVLAVVLGFVFVLKKKVHAQDSLYSHPSL